MRKSGWIFILAGILMIGASGFWAVKNQREDNQAGNAVDNIVPQVVMEIARTQIQAQNDKHNTSSVLESGEMPVKTIDGKDYIGVLQIPDLGLELPIMSSWTYDDLKIAPCRYNGSTGSDDLVIAAHNYKSHFGKLDSLSLGAKILFTGMDGITIQYEIVAFDILNPTDVDEMNAGEYDLSLYTCTYSGEQRITVRCDRV